jgi:hypothetical protein
MTMEKLLAVMVAAHMIGDFLLQPDWMAERKRRTGYLLLHTLIHAALVYVALQKWDCWQAPALVFVIHTLTDAIKKRAPDTAETFVMDQAAHAVGLLAIAWFLRTHTGMSDFAGTGYRAIVALGGFVATVQGAGFLVGKFMKRLVEESKLALDGLVNGGKWIGQMERALILVFVLIGYLEGIGFLVAAKSILRFKETEEQKMAEYVLIGTLLSFSLAIALAWVTKSAMGL